MGDVGSGTNKGQWELVRMNVGTWVVLGARNVEKGRVLSDNAGRNKVVGCLMPMLVSRF